MLGVLYALMQHDLKRLLAYHSVENIGIILLGLGAGMMALAYGHRELAWIGVAASLYHVLNHAVFKGLLFLGAGDVVMTTGTRQIEQLGGLLRRMPWTGLFFLVGAMAISGLPPLNGFASEWLTFQAFLYGFRGSAEPLVRFLFPVGGALLALTTALAAACFVKAFGISFLALPRSRQRPRRAKPPRSCWRRRRCWRRCASCWVCSRASSCACSAARSLHCPDCSRRRPPLGRAWDGVRRRSAFDHVAPLAFAAALVCGIALVGRAGRAAGFAARRVPTWGCGGELSAQTEYTATAFSKPLMMIFRAVYRPTRQVESLADVSPYFPQEVRYHAHIEPTFERYLYGPLLRAVLRIAERHEGPAGGQPSRLPCVRDRAGRVADPPRLVERLS